ncbi:SGS domain-containing protein [Rozella allomycis CSF55]|uniref:SGS domain-containing protein n=1 Tax=Rozella allomycis (strain CSF55) TaxID=988480 RepID=A0A075AVI0_ROZAC|nr:SGS domain-containing protein [Rozella allomycis CSF55]|eukprot:EPZ34125.1 SGS domain-containing protein [Rozella allomycis CSF55]
MSTIGKYKYEWYQNDDEVVFTVYIKNCKKEQTKVDFTIREFILNIDLGSSNSFEVSKSLKEDICPESSYFTKQVKGLKWASLEAAEEESLDTKPKPSYPSSSKNPKNWDSIEKEIKQEEEKDKPEGEDALNALFRKIYANADENTRRAMNKSFTESGGTCLSTNWEDVGKKKVEVSPPDGMEAKKWES